MKKIPWYWWLIGGSITLALINRQRVMNNLKNIQLSKNFNLAEFVVTGTGIENIPGPKEIENLRLLAIYILQPARDYLGVPIIINSGYRSPAVNAVVPGSAKNSQHQTGQASDIHVPGMTNEQLIEVIRKLKLPYDQLIDEQRGSALWVHVSYSGSGRREWLTRRDISPTRPNEYVLVKVG